MGAAASCIACGHPKAGANHLDPAAKPAAQPAALPLTADASRGAAAPTTAPSIAEELVRVQLQVVWGGWHKQGGQCDHCGRGSSAGQHPRRKLRTRAAAHLPCGSRPSRPSRPRTPSPPP